MEFSVLFKGVKISQMTNKELLSIWDSLKYGEKIDDYAGRPMERSSLLLPDEQPSNIVKDVIFPNDDPGWDRIFNYVLCDKKTFDERWFKPNGSKRHAPNTWVANGKHYEVVKKTSLNINSVFWANSKYYIRSGAPMFPEAPAQQNPLINTPPTPILQFEDGATVFSTRMNKSIPSEVLAKLRDHSHQAPDNPIWSSYRYIKCKDMAAYLAANKNINIETIPNGVFAEREYVNLVRPYLDLIATGVDSETNKRVYENKTDYSVLIEASRIDCELSSVLFDYIMAFESFLNSFLTDAICGAFVDLGCPLCNNSALLKAYRFKGSPFPCFRNIHEFSEYEPEHKIENILSKRGTIIAEIIDNLDKKSEILPESQMYMDKLGYIPLFVGIQSMKLADKVTLLQMMKYRYQEKFILEYLRKDKETCSTNINVGQKVHGFTTLLRLRNIISHHQSVISYIHGFDRYSFGGLAGTVTHLRKYYEGVTFMSNEHRQIAPISDSVKNPYNTVFVYFINRFIFEVNGK